MANPPAAGARQRPMPPELHPWLVATAATLSPALARDFASVGPVWFPDRPDHGPAAFLARAVVGQQISAGAARSIWGRIEGAARASGLGLAAFLAGADESALRQCGLSSNKVRAVLAIGAAAESGALAGLRDLDGTRRADLLCGIRGIGPWTADMLAIFYLREPDIWPEGDLAVQRVFGRYIARRRPARAAARFAPWRSVLALYLWRLAGGAV